MDFSEDDLNQPTAVVCIDIWKSFNTQGSIVDFLNKPQNKLIVLGSYSNVRERLFKKSHWYEKRNKIFYQIPFWYLMNENTITSELRRDNDRETRPELFSYNHQDKLCIGAYYSWELKYLLEKQATDIKNICFIGGNWNQCMIDRPLGWYKTSLNLSLNDYNIITFAPLVNSGFTMFAQDTIQLTKNWKKVNEEYYYFQNPNHISKSYVDVREEEFYGNYLNYSKDFDWGENFK